MAKYFGTDGIRLHEEDFSYGFLEAVVNGLIAYHGGETFSLLIGGDTRSSTARILQDLTSIAAAKNIKVVNIAVFPTPAINFYLTASGCDFAIDVTASHNPATYNGLKIFELKSGSSTKLCEAGRAAIEEALLAGVTAVEGNPKNAGAFFGEESGAGRTPATTVSPESRKMRSADFSAPAAIESYLNHLRDYLGSCDFRGLKIGMDCANGATSVIADALFREFGAEVTVINADQNFGTGINYNCGSTHLDSLQQLVTSQNLNFGIAFDGDGDRCLLVDHEGNIVDGDKILAILANYLELKSFVVTVMANQGLFAWANEKGITLEVTDVGDQNVYARMVEKGIKLGGEQSGHIILPLEPMGDGMLTALMLTKVIAELKTPLKNLAESIPTFPQVLLNLPATKEQKANLSSEPATVLIARYSTYLETQGGRLLVRPSGTEDLIRITIWGTEAMNIQALAEDLATNLKGVL